MKGYDIIAIGDVSSNTFISSAGFHVECHHGREAEDCTLCMKFGTKLGVDKLTRTFGGNSGNLAVGMGRLGLKTAIYCIVGDDTRGHDYKAHYKKNKVSTEYVKMHGDTNTSIILNVGPERTILVYHTHRSYHLPKLKPTKWIYFSSIGKGSEDFHKEIVEFVKKKKVKMGFNPGTYQMSLAKHILDPLIANSEAFIVNKEEAEFILKVAPQKDIRHLMKPFHDMGAKIVVVTDGPKGSYAFDGQNHYFCDIYDCPILERTGCGDSYSTGFIAGLIYGLSVKEAMKWGTCNAACVIQKIGPQEGLAHAGMIKDMIKKRQSFQTVEYKGE
jgi:sugar/nucleoside kinase (ribokinase family)